MLVLDLWAHRPVDVLNTAFQFASRIFTHLAMLVADKRDGFLFIGCPQRLETIKIGARLAGGRLRQAGRAALAAAITSLNLTNRLVNGGDTASGSLTHSTVNQISNGLHQAHS
ncbi:hypothetical protein ABK730_03270 [Klebsiella indica]|uniref:hypothetical protein n=1 Tax=Klebsiella indica TaxID=2582917 RepID=UPI00115711A0